MVYSNSPRAAGTRELFPWGVYSQAYIDRRQFLRELRESISNKSSREYFLRVYTKSGGCVYRLDSYEAAGRQIPGVPTIVGTTDLDDDSHLLGTVQRLYRYWHYGGAVAWAHIAVLEFTLDYYVRPSYSGNTQPLFSVHQKPVEQSAYRGYTRLERHQARGFSFSFLLTRFGYG